MCVWKNQVFDRKLYQWIEKFSWMNKEKKYENCDAK